MFSYVQIFVNNINKFNGFGAFQIKDGVLSISFMTGLNKTVREKIPLDKVKNLSENNDLGGKITFDFDDKHFVFLNSGFGESQYLKESILTELA